VVRPIVRAAVLSSLIGLVGCPRPTTMPPSAHSPLLRQRSPDFTRPTLGGETFAIGAQRGRVVVVEFFAEYCAPCRITLPEAQALHQRYPDVSFIGVSEDEYERQARAMVQAHGITFPVVMDRGGALAGRFRVVEIPATFVLDGAGVVRWVGRGAQTGGDLERAIQATRQTSP
jgi:cytochrome c biogenesis protein CcmG, thiol:disulfide interchange protein DsbE